MTWMLSLVPSLVSMACAAAICWVGLRIRAENLQTKLDLLDAIEKKFVTKETAEYRFEFLDSRLKALEARA